MGAVDIEMVLKQVEGLLAGAGELPAEAEQAVGMLLNVVETLRACAGSYRVWAAAAGVSWIPSRRCSMT